MTRRGTLLPFTEVWSPGGGGREPDSHSEMWWVLWQGTSGCYESLKEKLLTQFGKAMEGFCKELMSKLILKDEWKLVKEKEPKMGGGENWEGVESRKSWRQMKRVYRRTGKYIGRRMEKVAYAGALSVRSGVRLEWGARPDLTKPHRPHSGKSWRDLRREGDTTQQ